ncbi:MAG: HAD family hydrolase [Lachnospiraceae bacterium]|nr:HAD family hydrolase [Lachnospiraceae bacterium]
MSKYKYDAIIFDLDGTLLDTLIDLTNSVNYALEKNGFPLRSLEEIRSFVGNGIGKLINRASGFGSDTPEYIQILEDFKTHYKVHCNDNTCTYNGIDELLTHLKNNGIVTAIVSNKAHFAVQELEKMYFEGVVDYALGEMENVAKKPAPDMVNIVIEKLKLQDKKILYVGDSDVDIMTAKNSGLDIVCVDWGFRDRDFLVANGAQIIVGNTKEFLDVISSPSVE